MVLGSHDRCLFFSRASSAAVTVLTTAAATAIVFVQQPPPHAFLLLILGFFAFVMFKTWCRRRTLLIVVCAGRLWSTNLAVVTITSYVPLTYILIVWGLEALSNIVLLYCSIYNVSTTFLQPFHNVVHRQKIAYEIWTWNVYKIKVLLLLLL